MDIRVLKYFLAVAKNENISRAAEELHLTQPTLSRQLVDLENELGTVLFERGKRRTILTEAGMFLKMRAQEIVTLSDKTVAQFLNADTVTEGDVYIGCGETEGMREIIRAMKEIHETYPRVRFHLTSGNKEFVLDQLKKGILDFGVLCCSVPPVEYNYLKIPHEDVWGLFIHRLNPLTEKNGIAPEDLRNEPLIVSRQAMESKEFDHWLGYEADKLNIVGTYNLAFNAAFFTEQGFGSLLGLQGLIPTETVYRQEILFRPLEPKLLLGNYIVWKKGQAFSRLGNMVAKCFKKAFV